MTAESAPGTLLSVRDLTISFATEGGSLLAVDHVSFDVPRGKTLAIVGESGCGKSATAHAILRLLPSPPAAVTAAGIVFEGRDLMTMPERALREVRGGRIGMVFQEPMTSLNPVYTAGFQIAEAIRLHRDVSRREAKRLAIEGLRRTGIADPEARADSYPHELSGGMRQRVMLAIALACDPSLLIADEPTTALDATVQAQLLDRLQRLRDESGMSLLLVAHDLAVVASIADEILVMYAGVVMERGPAREVLRAPAHPYTRALLESIPHRGAYRVRGKRRLRLATIEGTLPDLRSPPPGCRFASRCPIAGDRCAREEPPKVVVDGLEARCFFASRSLDHDLDHALGAEP